ncbi:hypothetical protein Tco_1460582, partial [Tanacetum coccineum]
MRTRSQSRNLNRQQQQAPPAFVEPFNLEEPIENPAPPVVPMADNRTMAQLLQAPTEGYEDAIVIPEINANFELKHGLINLVQNKQFFGHDKEDPHAHIRYFNKITSTMRFPDIPSTSIKLMLFPFSLEEIRKSTDVNVNKLHQPWRSFAAIINKCLSSKPSYDSLCLSQAQILWGMYNNNKVDYAYLLWEDFTYQIENKNTKKGNAM